MGNTSVASLEEEARHLFNMRLPLCRAWQRDSSYSCSVALLALWGPYELTETATTKRCLSSLWLGLASLLNFVFSWLLAFTGLKTRISPYLTKREKLQTLLYVILGVCVMDEQFIGESAPSKCKIDLDTGDVGWNQRGFRLSAKDVEESAQRTYVSYNTFIHTCMLLSMFAFLACAAVLTYQTEFNRANGLNRILAEVRGEKRQHIESLLINSSNTYKAMLDIKTTEKALLAAEADTLRARVRVALACYRVMMSHVSALSQLAAVENTQRLADDAKESLQLLPFRGRLVANHTQTEVTRCKLQMQQVADSLEQSIAALRSSEGRDVLPQGDSSGDTNQRRMNKRST